MWFHSWELSRSVGLFPEQCASSGSDPALLTGPDSHDTHAFVTALIYEIFDILKITSFISGWQYTTCTVTRTNTNIEAVICPKGLRDMFTGMSVNVSQCL